MALINPHINFNGNAEEAFNFYRSVFGGDFAKIVRFKDLTSDRLPVSLHQANKIMHIALAIGNNLLMGNDVPEILGLSADGQIEFPIAESPWGSYFGMFRDKYGIEWMVDFDANYKGEI